MPIREFAAGVKLSETWYKVSPGFDLATFVQKHFTGPTPSGPTVNPAPRGQRLLDYVMSLWPILQQTATSVPPYSTL
jgi:hypothetical protein